MTTYNVVIEEPVEKNLAETFGYIKNSLGEPVVAKNLVNRIRKAIENLNYMPERFPVFHGDLRRMNVDNYAVLYRIFHEKSLVSVVAVIYSKRDIDKMLFE